MILRYVLKNFTRRKVRTILMILSLTVSIGLIVTMSATVETVRQSNVDIVANEVGRYDLAVSKRDTSSDLFVFIEDTAQAILAAEPRITAVYPRFETTVELDVGGIQTGNGYLLALDPDTDTIGYVEVISGTYTLGNKQVALLEDTAYTYGLSVGDAINVSYSFPLPREEGKEAIAGVSQRRTTETFTIGSIVHQDGVTTNSVREGIIVHIADVQAWLNLPGQSQTLIATVDPRLYESNNAEEAALEVRDIMTAVQAQLGDDYLYRLDKASAISSVAQGFLVLQALINTYGLISLGVVGLLVHTLVLSNVQEQRRDMAILRILGGQRNFLFALVIVEVIVIGVMGIALGVGLGQLITTYIVVPLIERQMSQVGVTFSLTPQVTLTAILPALISASVVLIVSAIKPAREASRTKVMHAINPGVADNIQIEDLAQLRERRPDFKMFLLGTGLMLIFVLIASFEIVAAFGGPAVEVIFVLLALGLLVLGLGLMFFITTVPFERLVLFVMSLALPRLTYFAQRNVKRGQARNTLISMLVLFSGVLPSFLATQAKMENVNYAESARQSMGAPASMEVFTFWFNADEDVTGHYLKPTFRTEELGQIAGTDRSAGITYDYSTQISDPVGFRSASLTVHGVDTDLNTVLFNDLIEFVGGTPNALRTILDEPNAIIISEGLADYLSVDLYDTLKITGEGTDHVKNVRIVGIARKIPSFGSIGRSRTTAQLGSQALISLDSFRELVTELDQPLPALDEGIITKVLFTLTPDADPQEMSYEIGQTFNQDYSLWTRFLELNLERQKQGQASQQIFLIVLTSISFTTAVFGVFAVIYVTIHSRRLEIGMLKAVGMKRRELVWMLILESIAMTLGAALAGIAAGASMGYISFYGQRVLSQTPTTFAVDTTVVPFIVIMIVLASIMGATFSARRIVKKRAVEILRM